MKANKIRGDRDAILGSIEDASKYGNAGAWAALEVAAQLAELNQNLEKVITTKGCIKVIT